MSLRITGWPAAGALAATFAVAMLGTTLPTPLYPLYAARFGFGELVSTVIFAVYAVGVTAGLLLFGHWSDQLGRKPLLIGGLVLSALSAGAFLIGSDVAWLLAGRLLSGLSAGIFTGTATASIVDVAPESGRDRAGLLAAAINMAGLGAGPVLAGVLAQYGPSPLRLCFVIDLLLIALGLACLLAVREPVQRATTLRLRPRRLHVPPDIRGVFTRPRSRGSPASPSSVCSLRCPRHSSARSSRSRTTRWWASSSSRCSARRSPVRRCRPAWGWRGRCSWAAWASSSAWW